MRLDLIDGGEHLVMKDQVHQPVRLEIAHPDGPDGPFAVKLLHRPPRTVDVAERLMDQVEVEIIELQAFERLGESPLRALVPGILHPEFRRDEKFLAGYAAPPDRPAHGPLIEIGRSGVDRTVTRRNRIAYTLFADRLFDLIDTETQNRHFDAVVQNSMLHFFSFY